MTTCLLLPLALWTAAASAPGAQTPISPPAGPTRPATDAWVEFRHDASNTGRTTLRGPGQPNVAWKVGLDDQRNINMQATVGPDGTVYVGAWGGGNPANYARGMLFAYRPDGARRWVFDPGPPEQPSQNQHPIWGTIEGTPVVDRARRRLYFGRGDNKLWCLTLSGQYLWDFPTFPTSPARLPELGGQVISPPTQGPDGTIYFGTVPYSDLAVGTVFAVSPDGVERWRYELPDEGGVWGSPALAPDGTLYVTTWSEGGKVVALRETAPGTVSALWTWNAPGNDIYYLGHATLAPDGGVYTGGTRVTGLCRGRAFLVALSATGAQRWYWEGTAPAEDATGGVSLDSDGALVFGTASTLQLWPLCTGVADGGRLYRATDAGSSLAIQWQRDFAGAVMGASVDRDGRIYASIRGDWGQGIAGRVVAVDRSGNDVWSTPVEVDGEIWASPPAIGQNGRLYVGTNPCADVPNFLPCHDAPELVAIGWR